MAEGGRSEMQMIFLSQKKTWINKETQIWQNVMTGVTDNCGIAAAVNVGVWREGHQLWVDCPWLAEGEFCLTSCHMTGSAEVFNNRLWGAEPEGTFPSFLPALVYWCLFCWPLDLGDKRPFRSLSPADKPAGNQTQARTGLIISAI